METKPSKVMEFGLKVRRKEDIMKTKKWQKITDVVVKVFHEGKKSVLQILKFLYTANIEKFVCLFIYCFSILLNIFRNYQTFNVFVI